MKFHKIASIVPMMSGTEYEEFKKDIEANGIHEPRIWTLDGKILDGRNRYRACDELGIGAGLDYREYGGPDPVQFVLSLNVMRRQLTASQLGMVAARMANLSQGRKVKTKASQDASLAVTQRQAARLIGVSRRTLQRASFIIKTGDPEVIEAIEKGTLTLPEAMARIVPRQAEAIVESSVTDKDVDSAVMEVRAARSGNGKIRKAKAWTKGSTAIMYAETAIHHLKRIEYDDPRKIEALQMVLAFVKNYLKKERSKC
jgi:ParB-like chromosome segregation protein Spo0J